MKKIMTLAAGVLCSTLVFANVAPGTTALSTGSSVSVMNSGSDLIKVFYKGRKGNSVMISIFNEKEEKVFSEKMKGENFMRPYNFKNLPAGQYTIQIEDAEGVHVQKIEYGSDSRKKVSISRLETKEGRYIVSGYLPSSDNIDIKIYNADGRLLHQDKVSIEGKFAKVYNLAAITGAFSIEVSDTNGSLQEFNSAD